MVDRDLQRAEAAWRISGSPEDEQALLAGRLRAGIVTWEDLELAGLFGNDAARELVRVAGRIQRSTYGTSIDETLLQHGRRTFVQYQNLIALQFLDFWRGWRAAPDGTVLEHLEKALGTVEAWLACPCEAHSQAASAADDARWNQGSPWVTRAVAGAVRAVTAPSDHDAVRSTKGLRLAPRFLDRLHRDMATWLVRHRIAAPTAAR